MRCDLAECSVQSSVSSPCRITAPGPMLRRWSRWFNPRISLRRHWYLINWCRAATSTGRASICPSRLHSRSISPIGLVNVKHATSTINENRRKSQSEPCYPINVRFFHTPYCSINGTQRFTCTQKLHLLLVLDYFHLRMPRSDNISISHPKSA